MMIPNSNLDTLDTTSRLSLKSLLSRIWREVRENLKDMSNVSDLALQIARKSPIQSPNAGDRAGPITWRDRTSPRSPNP